MAAATSPGSKEKEDTARLAEGHRLTDTGPGLGEAQGKAPDGHRPPAVAGGPGAVAAPCPAEAG